MDDIQRIVKCGTLSLHTPGGFFKRRWHSKYLVLYDGSKSGIKRLELFDSEIKFKKQSPIKIIPLVDCVRIVTCQRHKTTFTFEVRTNEQFYLLASKSFQDMNDWVNCLRLVAFGLTGQSSSQQSSSLTSLTPKSFMVGERQTLAKERAQAIEEHIGSKSKTDDICKDSIETAGKSLIDVLLCQQAPKIAQASTHSADGQTRMPLTASQAAAAAAGALARARQRQPSLLGSSKPEPPDDSPFLKRQRANQIQHSLSMVDNVIETVPAATPNSTAAVSSKQLDTLTPTVRGQLISAISPSATQATVEVPLDFQNKTQLPAPLRIPDTLDEEEVNMLYCSIEDNPSEHNYRVKVIETELALRCQLKCYQLSASKTISQQYEELAHFRAALDSATSKTISGSCMVDSHPLSSAEVTFYQLIIGPQELTLLNDYATAQSYSMRSQIASSNKANQQQGLWSWPYQCIRRYGFDKDNCFMFEAGRKCTSGPGQFIVQTPKAYNIYRDVVKFVNELRTISSNSVADQQIQRPLGKQPIQNDAPAVTQIPVIWTPVVNDPISRTTAQFFQALRQIDANAKSITGTDNQNVGLPRCAGGRHEQSIPIVPTVASSKCRLMNKIPSGADLTIRTSEGESLRQPVVFEQTATCHDNEDAPILKESLKMPAVEQSTKESRASNGSGLGKSEETDESGYEHEGDESVESSRASSEGHAQRGRESQVARSTTQPSQESSLRTMASTNQAPLTSVAGVSPSAQSLSFSSTSTISPNSSPGQSVSRRTGESIQMTCSDKSNNINSNNNDDSAMSRYLVDTRLALNKENESGQTRTSHDPNNGTKFDLRRLAQSERAKTSMDAGQSQLDFEASLIKDVYSEITKLHAKFAVTSTSSGAEDSISSDSRDSNATSSDQDQPELRPSLDRRDEGTDGYDDDGVREEDDEDEDRSDGCYYMNERHESDNGEDDYQQEHFEPMYSNLRHISRTNDDGAHLLQTQRYSGHKRQRQPPDADSFYCQRAASRTISSDQHRDCHTRTSLSPRSIYPAILNPIIEINESLPTTPTKGNGPLFEDSKSISRSISANNHVSSRTAPRDLESVPLRDRMGINKGCDGRREVQSSNKIDRSKPTKHYVINDVQYARISRNMASVAKFR